jgi:hypothetical protein
MDDTAGPAPDTVRVLYIAGWGRSGSTILGNILGQVEGHFFGGELRYLSDRGWNKNDRCGCGERFRECPFWREVLQEVDPDDLEVLRLLSADVVRTRQIPSLLLGGNLGLGAARQQRVTRALRNVYSRIREVSGADVIVDSSKSPIYARVLETTPGIRIVIVHLVRDPRATSFSWQRVKFDPAGNRYMHRHGPAMVAGLWLIWNLAVELRWGATGTPARYVRIRYEDFAAEPYRAVGYALGLLGSTNHPTSSAAGRSVEFGISHSVSGNPVRLQRGPIEISPDTEWRLGMKPTAKALITSATLPLLLHYRYPLLV